MTERLDQNEIDDVLDYCSLIRFCLYCAAGCILFVRFCA